MATWLTPFPGSKRARLMATKSSTRLTALFINASLKSKPAESHTARLVERAVGIMEIEGVDVEVVHARQHDIAFGMVKDATEEGAEQDDWPAIQRKVLAADMVVIASPIWLGMPSSVASLVIERLDAYSADTNDRGQLCYYGKVAGAMITGNEDGVKASASRILFALQHLGFTIPPQVDCGWIGEVGPGPSYGDKIDGQKTPVGYDCDFTNRNTTIMAWNLMHMARIIKDAGGLPAIGNTDADWKKVTNATDIEVTPVPE
jgi:multimeric flavodoxin WrbA